MHLDYPFHATSHLTHLETCVTHFDEVVLLLEELVGLLMTWHMGSWHILTYSFLDTVFLMLYWSPRAILGIIVHMLRHIVGLKECLFFSWRWLSVIHTPHVEALYHRSTCLI